MPAKYGEVASFFANSCDWSSSF